MWIYLHTKFLCLFKILLLSNHAIVTRRVWLCQYPLNTFQHIIYRYSSLILFQNDAEERVRRLEADKESLQLQVQVLSEQISAQSEKMTDLERALHDTRQRLDDAEQRLQKVN